jgi:hypothetical protein
VNHYSVQQSNNIFVNITVFFKKKTLLTFVLVAFRFAIFIRWRNVFRLLLALALAALLGARLLARLSARGLRTMGAFQNTEENTHGRQVTRGNDKK